MGERCTTPRAAGYSRYSRITALEMPGRGSLLLSSYKAVTVGALAVG